MEADEWYHEEEEEEEEEVLGEATPDACQSPAHHV